jgi:diguanylate cyclase (GGDEF)-like protein
VIDAPIIKELLDKSPLFRGIPHKILSPIFEQAVLISLVQGEQLLTPGIRNEHVYIIVSGQMGVHLTLSNLDEPFAILNPGECVGEMSVLVDSIVSAYVIARTDCQLLAIGYSSFWSLIKGSNESARNMLNILVQRVRMGNEAIADTLLRENKFPAKKAIIDSMTGLYNQHGMQEKFDRLLTLRKVEKQTPCLIFIKVDEANHVSSSDSEFSEAQPLHSIAQTILTFLKPDDCAAHLNGNTFAMLLPNLSFSAAYATADRLRALVCQAPVLLPDGSSLPPVKILVGVCKANDFETLNALITRATLALE